MGTRTSALESRHEALGASLADWNDMQVAWTYSQHTDDEHRAVREAAGLIDLSALRKVHITGPDAEAAADYLLPRDMTSLSIGRAVYSTILNEEGGIDDDAIIYRLGDEHFLLVFGTGETVPALDKAIAGRDASWRLDDDMHCISLQGPKALALLDANSPMDVASLKYFAQGETSVYGKPCILARTGYTGERGYDIFASADVVGDIWDAILEDGKSQGVLPFSFVGLNTVRIEAGLLFYPFDMTTTHTPWEAGLGWSVAADKAADYIGKDAVVAKKGKEKIKFVGVLAESDQAVGEPIAGGEPIMNSNGTKIGAMTAALYSNRLKQSIGFAQVDANQSDPGTAVSINGIAAKIAPLPFYDPEKLKPRGLA